MVLLEAVVRLIPGVLGDEASHADESFENGVLEYPQFTRPAEFEGRTIPPVLTSGDHAKVSHWRAEQSRVLTKARRPDLLKTGLGGRRKGADQDNYPGAQHQFGNGAGERNAGERGFESLGRGS